MTNDQLLAALNARFKIRTGQPGAEYTTIKGGPFDSVGEAITHWYDQFNATFGIDAKGTLLWIKPEFSELKPHLSWSMRPPGWYSHGRCMVTPTGASG